MVGFSWSWWPYSTPSVVVDEFDVVGMSSFEPKDDTPIGSHDYRPEAFEVAAQRVEPKGRHVDICDRTSSVDNGENDADTLKMIGAHPRPITLQVKTLQSSMSETHNHKICSQTTVTSDACQAKREWRVKSTLPYPDYESGLSVIAQGTSA